MCYQGIVYARDLDERELTLGVSGHLLEHRSMIMYDVETGSSWDQASGLAVAGPLESKVLHPLPSMLTDWGTWRSEHPDGTVVTSLRERRPYSRRFEADLDRRARDRFGGAFPIPVQGRIDRLHHFFDDRLAPEELAHPFGLFARALDEILITDV